ncbi:CBS domain-containing protein [Streptococcus suis]|nr:CBS domain-containing protein [Streptococcus suis]
MTEERFLQLFNDLDKVLRKVCGIADGEYADVGSMLTKAKDLSRHNPVAANWDKLYVARQLRNLMVHEKRTGLTEVAQPSQELIATLERVIEQYEHPLTLGQYLKQTQKPRPISFQASDRLGPVLEIVQKQHFSKFPIFSDQHYQGLLSENGLTNWLAQASQQGGTMTELTEQTRLEAVLTCEEGQLHIATLSSQTSLYQVVAIFEEHKRATVLVSRHDNGRIEQPQDLVGIITMQDVAELYALIGE